MDASLFEKYTEVEWKKIMKLRDIISHHYERMDHEIVYDICKNHIPILRETVQKIIERESA